MADPEAIKAQFEEAFNELSGGDGRLTPEDLKAALEKAGATPDEDQVQAIMEAAGVDGTGDIGFEEFCQAIVQAQFTKLRVIAAIRILMRIKAGAESGAISRDDLKAACEERGLGDNVDPDKVDEILAAVEDADGNISMEDFLEKLAEADFN